MSQLKIILLVLLIAAAGVGVYFYIDDRKNNPDYMTASQLATAIVNNPNSGYNGTGADVLSGYNIDWLRTWYKTLLAGGTSFMFGGISYASNGYLTSNGTPSSVLTPAPPPVPKDTMHGPDYVYPH